MNNKYITITEFAEYIKLSSTETYRLLKNNFSSHIETIDGIVNVEKEFVQNFLNIDDIKNTDFKEIENLKNIIVEKEKKIEELQIKLSEYTEKAFELAQSALNIQQQLNYITASKQEKKKGFIKNLFKKGISD